MIPPPQGRKTIDIYRKCINHSSPSDLRESGNTLDAMESTKAALSSK